MALVTLSPPISICDHDKLCRIATPAKAKSGKNRRRLADSTGLPVCGDEEKNDPVKVACNAHSNVSKKIANSKSAIDQASTVPYGIAVKIRTRINP